MEGHQGRVRFGNNGETLFTGFLLWFAQPPFLYSPGPPDRDAAGYRGWGLATFLIQPRPTAGDAVANGGLGPGSQTSKKESTPQPGPWSIYEG